MAIISIESILITVWLCLMTLIVTVFFIWYKCPEAITLLLCRMKNQPLGIILWGQRLSFERMVKDSPLDYVFRVKTLLGRKKQIRLDGRKFKGTRSQFIVNGSAAPIECMVWVSDQLMPIGLSQASSVSYINRIISQEDKGAPKYPLMQKVNRNKWHTTLKLYQDDKNKLKSRLYDLLDKDKWENITTEQNSKKWHINTDDEVKLYAEIAAIVKEVNEAKDILSPINIDEAAFVADSNITHEAVQNLDTQEKNDVENSKAEKDRRVWVVYGFIGLAAIIICAGAAIKLAGG